MRRGPRPCRPPVMCVLAFALASSAVPLFGQTTPLLSTAHIRAIREEASGERPLVDYRAILSQFSGFAPSPGGDRMAEYLAARMRQYGLEQVEVEGFPADGRSYVWAFLTEPSWEGEVGTLHMVEPRRELLADFTVHRVVLGRFSTNADARYELVDVGAGTSAADYRDKQVRGKLVLATGEPGEVHAHAVWNHGAAGVVWFRTQEGLERPTLVSNATIVPWNGPAGEKPGFAFSVPYGNGMALRRLLAGGKPLVLHATVKATTGPGEYKQVSAAIRGTDPSLPEVWIKAHNNYRNTGGANNLSGVGAAIEMARALQTLIAGGTLPRPRRTIRFFWSAEHYGATYQFHRHPDWLQRVFGMLNVDMTGFDQEKTGAAMWLYRLPHSLPHFLSDVAEEFLQSVGRTNTIELVARDAEGDHDPIYAPSGSRSQMRYGVASFWGPSDHEDIVGSGLRVPSVLYNDWPDPFLGTQEDDIDKIDATQMRRSIVTVAATAYYLATVDGAGAPTLVTTMVGAAQRRLADEGRRAFASLDNADAARLLVAHREGVNVLTQAIAREQAALESVALVGESALSAEAMARGRRQLAGVHDANLAAFTAHARARAERLYVTWAAPPRSAEEQSLGRIVPKRTPDVRGPVNIFRPEYGQAWLQERTKDREFLGRLAIARAGRYVWFEAVNFVDGKRTLLEIRDAVSAEYGPIDASAIEQYFRLLEKAGVVTMSQHSGTRP